MSVYDGNGHLKVTVVDGSTFTGLYAADGSINVYDASAISTWVGRYHPCGAWNGYSVDGSSFTGIYAPNGALNMVNEPVSSTGVGNPCGALNVSGFITGPDVTAPTITSPNTRNNTENTVLAHTLTANETVTWSIVGGADQTLFEISGNTLRWASNGTQDFETPADADTNNTYVVTVRATDTALNTTDQTITVTVTDADEVAPTITSANSANVNENATLSFSLTANETVTWSIVGGADQAQFEISGSTLRWVGNGTRDFESPADADTTNTYIVNVRATDTALNTADQTITITVNDVDDTAPGITSSNIVSVDEGVVLAHSLTANETVTWSIVGGADQGDFEISGSTLRWLGNGTQNFSAPADADANNTYIVTVRATDTSSNTTDQTITVTVNDVVSSTFPTVVSRTATSGPGTNATSHTITLPTHASGDMLVVFVSNDGTTGVTQSLGGSSSAGWTQGGFASPSNALVGCGWYWNICDSASESLVVTTSGSEMVSYIVYRLTGASAIEGSSSFSSNVGTADADPPNHAPSAGSKKYLWLVGGGWDGNTVVPSAAPTNYTNLTTVSHSSANGASTGSAERELEASSENPGVFTSGVEQWAVWTLAVHPT